MPHVAPKIRNPPSCWTRRGLSLQALRRTSSCFLLDQFVMLISAVFTLGAKRLKRHGKEWLPHGDRFPSKKMFHCRAADASLARTHAAASLQLGVGPACMAAQIGHRDILTATDDRFRKRNRSQLCTQGERFFHAVAEHPLSLST